MSYTLVHGLCFFSFVYSWQRVCIASKLAFVCSDHYIQDKRVFCAKPRNQILLRYIASLNNVLTCACVYLTYGYEGEIGLRLLQAMTN